MTALLLILLIGDVVGGCTYNNISEGCQVFFVVGDLCSAAGGEGTQKQSGVKGRKNFFYSGEKAQKNWKNVLLRVQKNASRTRTRTRTRTLRVMHD